MDYIMKDTVEVFDLSLVDWSKMIVGAKYERNIILLSKDCRIHYLLRLSSLYKRLEHYINRISKTVISPSSTSSPDIFSPDLKKSSNIIATLLSSFKVYKDYSDKHFILACIDLPFLLRFPLLPPYKVKLLNSYDPSSQAFQAISSINTLSRLSSFIKLSSPISPISSSKEKLSLLKQDFSNPSRFLFTTIRNKKILLEYDVELDLSTEYDFSDSVQTDFYSTSVCLLPDGRLLLAGGGFAHPSPETYIIDISYSPPASIRIGDLNFPRSCIKLICYHDTVFAFGGWDSQIDSRRAECLKWQTQTRWTPLPDMCRPRYDFGYVIRNERIFIVGGSHNTTVEYYDLARNRFVSLNIKVPYGGNNTVLYKDKVYVIDHSHINTYDKNLISLESRYFLDYEFFFAYNSFICSSNCVIRNESMYYIKSDVLKLYVCDFQRRSRAVFRSF
jgi:hypothetical protein